MAAGEANPGTFRSAWQHRRWRPLLASYAISTLGDFLFSVALVVYLIEETGSAGWVAGSVIARIAVAAILGPLGGVVADRVDKRRLMVTLDLARVGLFTAAAVSVASGAPVLMPVVLTVISSALTTAYRPAAIAATPLLVPAQDLATANAAEATAAQLAWFAGPALGALLVATAGAPTAFAVNALTYAISALLVSRIGTVGALPGELAPRRTSPPVPREQAWTSLRAGGQAVASIPGLGALTLLIAAIMFAFGVEQVVHVFVARDRLDLGADGVGLLNAFLGAGGLLAAPFVVRLARRSDTARMLALSGVAMGLPLALLAFTSSVPVACALMMVEGAGNVAMDVLFITILQRACPEHLLGRVFGLQDSSGALAQLGGTIAAPLLVAGVDLEAALIVGGGVLVLTSLVTLAPLYRVDRRTEAERLRLAPLVTRLGGLGIFDDAAPASLERLAKVATARTARAGTAVVVEGEPSDDLYVITSGRAQVSALEHGVVSQLGPDEWFGEIGLLHRIARTATVTALDDVELLVIPGPAFVAALSGETALSEPLRRTMDARLLRTHPQLTGGGVGLNPRGNPAPFSRGGRCGG